MRRFASLGLIGSVVLVLARSAPADDAGAPSNAPASTANAAPSSSSAAPDSDPAPTNKAVTGYGYHDRPPAKGASRPAAPHRAHAAAHSGPIATLPGFEMLADGSSRFFVQLSQQVPVEEKKAKGTITYVLRGAHVAMRNNENALVTVHFNTPVTRARLIPVAQGLAFVMDLRVDGVPTFKTVSGKDGSAILEVDFPKGSYLPSGQSVSSRAPASEE